MSKKAKKFNWKFFWVLFAVGALIVVVPIITTVSIISISSKNKKEKQTKIEKLILQAQEIQEKYLTKLNTTNNFPVEFLSKLQLSIERAEKGLKDSNLSEQEFKSLVSDLENSIRNASAVLNLQNFNK
ncbi:hypothetical protein ACWXVL_00405 [Mycoplasma sp. 128]